ncbi:hypothetical protein [Prevotella falsenii]|uniref:hypothetical protein n=1 Tax=Prevotella falsenii TaxID=515414 RepID=UPI000468BB03|nr:hypothetical protein [Prevotella falsenii]
MRRRYIIPETGLYSTDIEQELLVRFSQVDNDGDGKTDQRPIIDGDPEDGEIGGKGGWFDDDFDY